EIETDIFVALISSIVSQQISIKAAATVYNRLLDLAGGITGEKISKLKSEDIQKCGMTLRKAEYIKGIAAASLDGTIDLDGLHRLPDEWVIKELTKLKGVGEWTAEMLLIHSLQRPNVLSYKDLGIRRGMMRLYGLEEISKADFEIYRKRYHPHNTVASIYLWELSK
ncbi:MAG: DNA-3-methyladenine glycosylase 2 family protein, partial [Tissierellaceae bacterium]|nr:DNA-3-methyladenine glycosylase 2 family protein [Tissierellaceae bacterium]